ncbi:acyl-CoA thioesterase [Psychroflexus maritimus]|uniref:Acyl-CoA thioesterase n=1 Tax=Psychroflexus maritimus TaxID=2714865 RepID=A0A967AL06_9FLAO|nr:acyl-CoA thioesterase [Psychroflexus maritimus]NGZ90239.1 acyl-CoA thioesterase [Psychroflexus maritimus]
MNAIKYSKTIQVQPEHIDTLNHVNNLTYMKWVMEIAEEHWKEIAYKEIIDQYAWVVLEHHMYYKSPAFLGDELEISTWIKSHGKFKSLRAVEMKRISDQKVVAYSETNWCFIDQEKQKPASIFSEVVTPFFED